MLRSANGSSRRAVACLLLAAGLGLGPGRTARAVPPMLLSRMTFVSATGEESELLVEAAQAVVDTQTNRAQLESVHAQWMGDDGQVSLDLTCERGEFDLATNDFVAIGDVQGRLADGRRFEGPWVRYDRAGDVAFTDAPVTILDDATTLRGGGFRYSVGDGRLRLTKGASVVEKP